MIHATDEELTCFGTKTQVALPVVTRIVNISASSVNIGQIVGALLGGYIGGRFGPKTAIMASCVPAGLGWILIAVSPHFAVLVLGRIVCGLSSSFCSANISLLVAQYR